MNEHLHASDQSVLTLFRQHLNLLHLRHQQRSIETRLQQTVIQQSLPYMIHTTVIVWQNSDSVNSSKAGQNSIWMPLSTFRGEISASKTKFTSTDLHRICCTEERLSKIHNHTSYSKMIAYTTEKSKTSQKILILLLCLKSSKKKCEKKGTSTAGKRRMMQQRTYMYTDKWCLWFLHRENNAQR